MLLRTEYFINKEFIRQRIVNVIGKGLKSIILSFLFGKAKKLLSKQAGAELCQAQTQLGYSAMQNRFG